MVFRLKSTRASTHRHRHTLRYREKERERERGGGGGGGQRYHLLEHLMQTAGSVAVLSAAVTFTFLHKINNYRHKLKNITSILKWRELQNTSHFQNYRPCCYYIIVVDIIGFLRSRCTQTLAQSSFSSPLPRWNSKGHRVGVIFFA